MSQLARYTNVIDGAAGAPALRRMTTSNPYTAEARAEVDDDPAAVDTAVRAARRAFEDGPWATMPPRCG